MKDVMIKIIITLIRCEKGIDERNGMSAHLRVKDECTSCAIQCLLEGYSQCVRTTGELLRVLGCLTLSGRPLTSRRHYRKLNTAYFTSRTRAIRDAKIELTNSRDLCVYAGSRRALD